MQCCFAWQRLFPKKPAAQALGILTVGFLPANLYLGMSVTNDPMAGLWVTLACYLFLRMETGEKGRMLTVAGLGLALGLAILTKFNSVLVLPVFLAASGIQSLRNDKNLIGVSLRNLGIIAIVCLLTCGWHYVRAWQQIGALPLPNSQTNPAAAWWQYPGYRTSSYFLSFGQALGTPVFSGLQSFADGIYSTFWADGLISGHSELTSRPPWNYDLMSLSCLVAMVPTILIIIGFIIYLRKCLRTPEPVPLLLAGMLAALVTGIMLLALQSPWISPVKAFYALPALVPLSAMIAAGAMAITRRNRTIQTTLWILLLLWLTTTYSSYWIRDNNHELWRNRAYTRMMNNDAAGAKASIDQALQLNPTDARSRYLLAGILQCSGNPKDAINEGKESLRLNPNSPAVLNDLAQMLSFGDTQEKTDAVTDARHACELTDYRQVKFIVTLAETQFRAGQLKDSIESFELASELAKSQGDLKTRGNLVLTLNNLAWLLATQPGRNTQDGVYAIRLAHQACEMTGNQKTVFLGTLAAAYARAGNFEEAVKTGEKSLCLGRATR